MQQNNHSIVKPMEKQIIYAESESAVHMSPSWITGWSIHSIHLRGGVRWVRGGGTFWQKNDGAHAVYLSGDLKLQQGARTRVKNNV